MNSSHAPKPFTHLISHILLAVVVIYFVINMGVVFTCIGSGIHSCASISPLPSFEFIPAIRRPVSFLMGSGNPDRAAIVLEIYSFAWLTGLAALATMIAAAALLSLRTSKEERAQTRALIEIASKEAISYASSRPITPGRSQARPENMLSAGAIFLGLAALAAFLNLYWGFYSFETWSAYLNMVHVRDRDFFMMGIAWSGLLMMALFFIMSAITRFILPPATSTANSPSAS